MQELTDIQEWVFTFGSNLAGRHGKGAALTAVLSYGAKYGEGIGHFGNSYAIPTKGHRLEVLSPMRIAMYVRGFIEYAVKHPELTFKVTKIGCGHAKLTADIIAPMFTFAPSNCLFDGGWKLYLPIHAAFWGKYEDHSEIRRVDA